MILKTELFPHQMEAHEKLRHIKIGALYMEQGTGKTRTALELINLRLNAGKIDKVLWLCPCNVKEDLKFNMLDHTDDIDMIYIFGIESVSQSDRLYLKLLDFVSCGKVFLIVDESNLVKNHFAKRTNRIQTIAQSCPYRLILNGTPISKNEADLFAQWYILDKRILGYNSFWSFAANHLEYDENIPGKVNRVLNINYLTRKIAPYSYIIKKDECLKLPDKHYDTYHYNLTCEQREHYEYIKDILLDNVNEFDSTTIYRLFTGLQQVVSGRKINCIYPLKSAPMFDCPISNPRIEALLNILPDDRVIIWCKFKHEISDISEALKNKYGNGSVALFYGDIKQRDRRNEIEKFKNGAQFLLANKVCGGYGLNLQFCYNSIYYSNDFNWATRAQSEDRMHRIGQTHDVNIADLCARSKIDERILSNLWKKENLSDSFKKELKNNRERLSDWLDGKD
jgi:SNF2 family DNA or RNA helicase